MANYPSWLPGPRTEIIEMCRSWNEYLTADRRTAWGIPQAQYNELLALFDTAQAALRKAMDKAERTQYQNPPSVADFGAGVCALRKLHLSGYSRTALVTAASMPPKAKA